MQYHAYVTLFVALLAITNPIGAVAIFIGLVGNRSPEVQRSEALKSMFSIFIILLIVTWLGNLILKGFGISPSAFEVGGALVIILLGLSMLNAHGGQQYSTQNHTEEEDEEAKHQQSVAVIPISLPLVAGPGAITTIIIHLNHMNGAIVDKFVTSIICLVLAFIFGIGFMLSKQIHRLLKDSGIKIATRIMGLILIAIAFSMMQEGLGQMFPGWLG